MSIARGVDWGEPAPLPEGLPWFDDDASAADFLAPLRRSGEELPAIGLSGGDLCRTLGGRPGAAGGPPGPGLPGPESAAAGSESAGTGQSGPGESGACFGVDLGAVLLDGRLRWFLAHCVIRRSWLRGRVIVAANAAFVGAWNIAPKAHPGDGRLDILDGDPPLGERLRARRRLPAGSHLPHPDIEVRRVRAAQFELDRPTPVFLDGRRAGEFRRLSLRLEPDALQVWIRTLPQPSPSH